MHQKKNTVLIIDDEPVIRKVLAIALEGEEFKIVECGTGAEGKRLAASVRPDLVLLDLELPDVDGHEVITQIRGWSQLPIIVCSVKNFDGEVIRALQAGADDYITKPFNPAVVLARIRANLRKAATAEAGEPEIANGHLRMDLVRHEVFLDNRKLSLTPKEYDLLRYLLVNRGKMLTHHDILRQVWGNAHVEDMQYLRVYVRQLRDKIELDPAEPSCIVTEPGIGYRMEIMPEPAAEPLVARKMAASA